MHIIDKEREIIKLLVSIKNLISILTFSLRKNDGLDSHHFLSLQSFFYIVKKKQL